ncbi:PREDICTED: stress response protein NST1-like [Camelina sativa]|uniref:Stress response protein NST1-like n=1 Tax=Camelina sativa TaxID=90675 RepID=A0ABM0X9D2_CAMSA|nr:PREDICTED: stress response protein NST1-like [Camelina sativa]
MDNSSSMRKQAQPTVRKAKKKQVKDEVDRIKQAEKKKRRLEKAIATSAAIRAELEKKKQMKKEGLLEAAAGEEDSAEAAKKKQERDELERSKQAEKKTIQLEKSIATSAAIRVELAKKKLKKLEEQKRLDEEGAAIAEAVALHVLLGEDCDDSYRNMLNQETEFKPWDYTTKFNFSSGGRNRVFPHQRCSSYAVHHSNNRPRDSSNWLVSYEPFARGWDGNNNNLGISADLIAAQAVSSLQISENTDVNAIVFNEMFRR